MRPHPHPRFDAASSRLPLGMAVAGGFFVGLPVAVTLGAVAGRPGPGWAQVTLAVGLAVSCTASPPRAVAPVAGLWFLLADSFLENTQGHLTWHGAHDAVLLAGLFGAAVLGCVAGGGRRQPRRPGHRRRGPRREAPPLPCDVRTPTLAVLPDGAWRDPWETGPDSLRPHDDSGDPRHLGADPSPTTTPPWRP